MTDLDFSARYKAEGWPGVAFTLLGWATEERYEGDALVCHDEDCDHALSEMCWAAGDTSIVESDEWVRAVMVGDDHVHTLEVSTLHKIGDDEYCHGCGQLGCTADGR